MAVTRPSPGLAEYNRRMQLVRIDIDLLPAKKRLRIQNYWLITCMRCGFMAVCHCGPYHIYDVKEWYIGWKA